MQAPAEADALATPVTATGAAAKEQKRLLIVDDEPGIRDVLKDVLTTTGYLVDTAANGVEAVRCIDNQQFDLIISDLCMPEMDGETLYKSIRERDKTMAGRMIFVTGDTVSSKSRQFLESSGSRWLSKPFNIRDVEDLVGEMLGQNPVAANPIAALVEATNQQGRVPQKKYCPPRN